MRQAGRYLPEYRKVRAEAGSFLDLCYNPELACEVTLQPIRRYGFDAAVLFSDILVIPDALGQKVSFKEGEGPQLSPLEDAADLKKRLSFSHFEETLDPVFQTLRLLEKELPQEVALIGFAGAPWTMASYMIEGGSSRDFARAKAWAYEAPESFEALIDLLVEADIRYLRAQVEAGAEALQIFDSWAGVWPHGQLRRWCLGPVQRIIAALKESHPEVPIIHFPRGVGPAYLDFAAESGADGLSLDTTIPPRWAVANLPENICLQGNLDPQVLLAGGALLRQEVQGLRQVFAGRPYIFNLGHGILPPTPPEHVAILLEELRAS
jgi:uroporphyrinogen decarboxylase